MSDNFENIDGDAEYQQAVKTLAFLLCVNIEIEVEEAEDNNIKPEQAEEEATNDFFNMLQHDIKAAAKALRTPS